MAILETMLCNKKQRPQTILGSFSRKALPSLKLTASLHLKKDGLEYDRFLLGRGMAYFQVRLLLRSVWSP